METVSERILNAAHERRRPFVAFGSKNDTNPVEPEATSGHEGTVQTYSYENSANILNSN